jgi:Protein of unknown function (DUF4199)
MKQTVLKYSLRAGAILSALMVLTFGIAKLVGYDHGGIGSLAIGYTTMVLGFTMIHFGIRSYRDTVAGGQVRFWPALRVGLLITLIASACYAATWQVVGPLFLPDFAEKYGAQAVRQAETEGKSVAEVQKIRDEMAKFAAMYKNPIYNFGMTILEPSPVGVLMSLISATLLSRKRRPAVSSLGTAVS